MFYLENATNGNLAHMDSAGQHDGKVTDRVENAAAFETFGEASEYSQNFNDLWNVVEY